MLYAVVSLLHGKTFLVLFDLRKQCEMTQNNLTIKVYSYLDKPKLAMQYQCCVTRVRVHTQRDFLDKSSDKQPGTPTCGRCVPGLKGGIMVFYSYTTQPIVAYGTRYCPLLVSERNMKLHSILYKHGHSKILRNTL